MINQWRAVRPVERDPADGPVVRRRFWLPLLAMCLYVMLWLGWWLYRLFNLDIEPVGSEFPDIDRAWDQAVEALGRADIALDNAPLFLVLGWPSASEDDFFRAAGIKGPVRQVPGDPTAPLHVTANRDGIWLTCAGACLLGQYHDENPAAGVLEEVMATMSEESADPFKTMGMGAAGAATLRIEDFQATFKEAQARSRRRKKRVEDPEVAPGPAAAPLPADHPRPPGLLPDQRRAPDAAHRHRRPRRPGRCRRRLPQGPDHDVRHLPHALPGPGPGLRAGAGDGLLRADRAAPRRAGAQADGPALPPGART